MNYGQVQYKKMKEEKAKRAAQRNLTEKGMRIKALISDHDLDRKLDRAVAYMKKGHKVTFTLITRWDQLQVNEKALTDVYQRILRGLPMSNIIVS
jgi:translation initiation factor IF-3